MDVTERSLDNDDMGLFKDFVESTHRIDLESAVDFDDLRGVKESLNDGSDPNTLPADGEPLLAKAIRNGSLAVVVELLKNGANPCARTPRGEPLLVFLCARGRVGPHRSAIARALLESGASVDAVSDDGSNALIAAVYSKDSALVSSLLDFDFSWEKAVGAGGETPLHVAVLNKDWQMVKILAAKGAPAQVADDRGLLPRDYLAPSAPLSVKKIT